MFTIKELWVYPVKSLRGIAVNSWLLTEQGLAYDRHWMLVMPNGRFVTQRQLASLALIDTQLENGQLLLSASGKGSVALALSSSNNEALFDARVWHDQCEVVESSLEVSSWLNRVLKPPQPLRLVAMGKGKVRPQSAPERFGEKTQIQFADAAPLLIANNNSLIELNKNLQQNNHATIDMRRFRPNIIVDGMEPFQEHQIKTLESQSSQYRLNLIDHCERCIITTINPDTAEKDATLEPLKTLTEINPMPANKQAAAFGVNATVQSLEKETLINVSDRLDNYLAH
jgi:uncharacterized protein YcbX